jgi:hypothetical protein
MRLSRRSRNVILVALSAALFFCLLSINRPQWIATDYRTGAREIAQVFEREFLVGPAEARQSRGRGGRTSTGGQSSGSWETNTRRTSASSGSSRTNSLSSRGSSNSSQRSTSDSQTAHRYNGDAASSQRYNRSFDTKDEHSNSPSDDGTGDDGDSGDAAKPPSTVSEALGLTNNKSKSDNNGRRRKTAGGEITDGPRARFPKQNDVLVRNINETAKQRLEAKGYKVETKKSIKSDGQSIVRVVPPGQMKGDQALEEIGKIAPDVSVFANESYLIITPPSAKSASSDVKEGSPDFAPEPGPRAGQCRDDRCFGRLAIGWNSGLSNCTRKAKIGVIDTPVDLEHPALKNQKIRVGSFLGPGQRSGKDWHGTAVLSLLSGRNDSGVPGLAPDAEYYVAEAFQTDASGDSSSSTFALLQALEWLDGLNVKIVNMSFSGPPDALVEQSIKRMQSKGVLFVAAAGNFGPTAPESYPAAYENVVAVTALSKDRENYRNANRGSYIDLAAPGVKIWTALPGGKEGYRTGTSFAAPYVTGILAASLAGAPARAKDTNELLSRLEVEDLGEPGPDEIFGRGLALAPKSCNNSSPPVARAPTRPDNPKPELSFGTLTVKPAVPSFTAGAAGGGLGFTD